MDKIFEICFANTKEFEAGFYDNPLDSGGPTMYGIAYNYNKERLSLLGITDSSQMIELTLQQAKYFYNEFYYKHAKCHLLGKHIEFIKSYFDMVIHSGVNGAGKCLQKTINKFKLDKEIGIDGDIGKHSLIAFNSLIDEHYDPDEDTNDYNLKVMYNAQRATYYLDMYNTVGHSWYNNKRFLNSALRRL